MQQQAASLLGVHMSSLVEIRIAPVSSPTYDPLQMLEMADRADAVITRGDARPLIDRSNPLDPRPFNDPAGRPQCQVCGTIGAQGRKCTACIAMEEDLRELLARRAGLPARRAHPGRIYPVFRSPLPLDAEAVWSKAVQLHNQTGLGIDPGQVLEAPWIGKTPGKARPTKSRQSTSEGWRRKNDEFWRAFVDLVPESAELLDGGRRVTTAYQEAMGWPPETKGHMLVHHHIDNGPFVVLIPLAWHKLPRVHRDESVIA